MMIPQDHRSGHSSSSDGPSSKVPSDPDAAALAEAIADRWGVTGALGFVMLAGKDVAASVLEDLESLRAEGKLPPLRNPAGYFVRSLLNPAYVGGMSPRANPNPPTKAEKLDRLDPYRRAYGKYLKERDVEVRGAAC